jgi:hypothetical protein
MMQLHAEQSELTYEGAFVKPAFSLIDSPGKLCDVLLEALAAFGCTSADLVLEDGEPGERGITLEVDELDARVTFHGDRIEVHVANLVLGSAGRTAPVLADIWSGLARLNDGPVAKTHSILFEIDAQIRGASYQDLLNRLARAPEILPEGTETAVVYYLPSETPKGIRESSLVFNRSACVAAPLETLRNSRARLKAA